MAPFLKSYCENTQAFENSIGRRGPPQIEGGIPDVRAQEGPPELASFVIRNPLYGLYGVLQEAFLP